MTVQNQFEEILKYIKDYKTKNEGDEAKNIDDFCETLNEFVEKHCDDYNELYSLFINKPNFRVITRHLIMWYAEKNKFFVDRSNRDIYRESMNNYSNCGEWCYIDLTNKKIEKWEDVASTFIENAEETIEDIYSKNFERAKDYE